MKPSSGEGESEKVRLQSDLDFFAGVIICLYVITWSVYNDKCVELGRLILEVETKRNVKIETLSLLY